MPPEKTVPEIYDYLGIGSASAAYELVEGAGQLWDHDGPALAVRTANLYVAIPVSQHDVFVDALSPDRLT